MNESIENLKNYFLTEEGYIIEVLHGQGTVIDVYGKEEYQTHLNEVNKHIENTK